MANLNRLQSTLLVLLCFFGSKAIAQVRFTDNHKPLSRNGVYHGGIKTDSVFYDNQLSFVNRDTALFFLSADASRLNEIPCAAFYRVAPINKYYQLTGMVTDYFLDNDAVAAKLSYNNGLLDGPCSLYYRNGEVRAKGVYTKNTRTGIWEYFYENGGKEKTTRFTDSGVYLIDCYTEKGEPLAQDGNGRFEGKVLTGKANGTLELKMSGPVKNGIPDGEWKLYSPFLPKPLFEETFSNGGFVHGVSTSLAGSEGYDDQAYSSVESVQPMEALDQYSCSDFCTMAGKMIRTHGGDPFKPLPEIGNGIKDILESGKYKDYSGWVLMDVKYNEKAEVVATSVRLYQENEAFRKELLGMLAHMTRPKVLNLDGKDVPTERFYLALVEANDVLIPEQVLEKRKQTIKLK